MTTLAELEARVVALEEAVASGDPHHFHRAKLAGEAKQRAAAKKAEAK